MRFALLILTLIVVPAMCPQSSDRATVAPSSAQSFSLPERESLRYTIEWRLITAGRARLDWAPAPTGRNWQVGLRLESVGLVSKLYKVEDDYTALLNQSLCAQSSQLMAREASRRRDTRVTFDGEKRKANYLEKDLVKNTVVLSQETDIAPCVHDVVGGLYFLRTLNLEPGQTTQIPMSDGKKNVMAKIEAQAREELKVPAGTFKTIRYEAYLFNNVLYRRPAHLYIWLSDDRRRVPVQIRVRMQFTTGTVTLQLDKPE
jgi:hypothetical protein